MIDIDSLLNVLQVLKYLNAIDKTKDNEVAAFLIIF